MTSTGFRNNNRKQFASQPRSNLSYNPNTSTGAFSGQQVLSDMAGEETLLMQFKKCADENDKKLRNARNIKELVNIEISHLPASVRHNDVDGYDFKKDPLQFNQKMPCIADRNFLVNQAILQGGPRSSKAGSKLGRNTRDQRAVFSEMAAESTHYPMSQQTTYQQQESWGRKNKQRMSMQHTSETGEYKMTIKEEQETKPDIINRGSQLEAVQTLQEIFKRQKKTTRKPGVNYVVEKYRNQRNRTAGFVSSHNMQNRTQTNLTNMAGYINNEDIFSEKAADIHQISVSQSPSQQGYYETSNLPSIPPQSQMMISEMRTGKHHQQQQLLTGQSQQDAYEQSPQSMQGKGAQMQSDNSRRDNIFKHCQDNIKQRLLNLKDLFEAEEAAQKPQNTLGGRSMTADSEALEANQVILEDQINRKKNQQDNVNNIKSVLSQNETNTKDSLAEFIAKKIEEAKRKRVEIDAQEFEAKHDDNRMIQFKASTLHNIKSYVPQSKYCYEENQFKSSFNMYRKDTQLDKQEIVQQKNHSKRLGETEKQMIQQIEMEKRELIAKRQPKSIDGAKQPNYVQQKLLEITQGVPQVKGLLSTGGEQTNNTFVVNTLNNSDTMRFRSNLRGATTNNELNSQLDNSIKSDNRGDHIAGIGYQLPSRLSPKPDFNMVGNITHVEHQISPGSKGTQLILSQTLPITDISQMNTQNRDIPSAKRDVLLEEMLDSPVPVAIRPRLPKDANVVVSTEVGGSSAKRPDATSNKQISVQADLKTTHVSAVMSEGIHSPTAGADLEHMMKSDHESNKPGIMSNREKPQGLKDLEGGNQVVEEKPEEKMLIQSEQKLEAAMAPSLEEVQAPEQPVHDVHTVNLNDTSRLNKVAADHIDHQKNAMNSAQNSLRGNTQRQHQAYSSSSRQGKESNLSQYAFFNGQRVKKNRGGQARSNSPTNHPEAEMIGFDLTASEGGTTMSNLDGMISAGIHSTPGAQMSYFCPKRFNRYPRFTLFYKQGPNGTGSPQSQYVLDNTVSLNQNFLRFLAEKTLGENATAVQSEPQPQILQEDQPSSFDPFEKVVLVKGIDNQILTSFRTLKGENNTVSDTFKIVHRKFQGVKHPQNHFYKTMALQVAQKLQFKIDEMDMETSIDEALNLHDSGAGIEQAQAGTQAQGLETDLISATDLKAAGIQRQQIDNEIVHGGGATSEILSNDKTPSNKVILLKNRFGSTNQDLIDSPNNKTGGDQSHPIIQQIGQKQPELVKIEKSGSGPVMSRGGDHGRDQRKEQFDSLTLQMQKESIKGSEEGNDISQKDASILMYNQSGKNLSQRTDTIAFEEAARKMSMAGIIPGTQGSPDILVPAKINPMENFNAQIPMSQHMLIYQQQQNQRDNIGSQPISEVGDYQQMPDNQNVPAMSIVSNALFLSTTGQNNNPYKTKSKRKEDRDNKLNQDQRIGSAGDPQGNYNARRNVHQKTTPLSQGHASQSSNKYDISWKSSALQGNESRGMTSPMATMLGDQKFASNKDMNLNDPPEVLSAEAAYAELQCVIEAKGSIEDSSPRKSLDKANILSSKVQQNATSFNQQKGGSPAKQKQSDLHVLGKARINSKSPARKQQNANEDVKEQPKQVTQEFEDFVERLAENLSQKKAPVSNMIDQIYKKERRYVRNFDKDNFLLGQCQIFQLDRVRNLKTFSGVDQVDSTAAINYYNQNHNAACTTAGLHSNSPSHPNTNPQSSFLQGNTLHGDPKSTNREGKDTQDQHASATETYQYFVAGMPATQNQRSTAAAGTQSSPQRDQQTTPKGQTQSELTYIQNVVGKQSTMTMQRPAPMSGVTNPNNSSRAITPVQHMAQQRYTFDADRNEGDARLLLSEMSPGAKSPTNVTTTQLQDSIRDSMNN